MDRQACAPAHLADLAMVETSEDFLLAEARASVDSMVAEGSMVVVDSTVAGATDNVSSQGKSLCHN